MGFWEETARLGIMIEKIMIQHDGNHRVNNKQR
jgi:hypothetical protein